MHFREGVQASENAAERPEHKALLGPRPAHAGTGGHGGAWHEQSRERAPTRRRGGDFRELTVTVAQRTRPGPQQGDENCTHIQKCQALV